MRPSFGGRRFQPARENVHDPDDFRDYRHGSAAPSWPAKRTPLHRSDPSQRERRERYATAVARAEFGRFYWNGKRRGELEAAMKPRRKPARSDGKTR
jgi:hypothetical protein